MRAYLLDDEPLALARLERLLRATGRVEIVGSHQDPMEAVEQLTHLRPDLLFLDIHMPALTGFELLAALDMQPLVVFTTAYDQYALEAFQANSIDYLLKPIEPERLDRALDKAERLHHGSAPRHDVSELVAQILRRGSTWIERIASRTGEKVELVDLARVTHFFASDKLTFASTPERNYVVSQTITELETKLNPARFVRIHRGAILSLDHVQEMHTDFGGRMVVRLKDGKRTELPVSRDRVRSLKRQLGL
jgi:two-component system LytT family response regulator